MTTSEIIRKLNSVQLSIYAHPDRQPDSEFAECVDILNEVIAALQEDEPKPVRHGFKERLEAALKEQKRAKNASPLKSGD